MQLATPAQLSALCAHAERRFESNQPASGRPMPCVVVASVPVRSLWREVGLRLDLGSLPGDVEAAATQLAGALAEQGGLVMGALASGSTWDVAVAESLGRRLGRERAGLVLLLVPPGEARPTYFDNPVFELEATPCDDSLTRWWRAVSEQGLRRSRGLSAPEFEVLERRWRRALHVAPVDTGDSDLSRALGRLSSDEVRLLRRLGLVHRPWPRARLEALGGPGAEATARRLFEAGLLETAGASAWRLVDDLPLAASDSDASEKIAAAGALVQVGATDPWAQAQAAVLLAAAGSLPEAEAAHVRAIRLANDVVARSDLWASWGEALEAQPPSSRPRC